MRPPRRWETGSRCQRLCRDNVPGLENVGNLEQLPATGFEIIALPMKIAGGSGGPCRIVAVIDP